MSQNPSDLPIDIMKQYINPSILKIYPNESKGQAKLRLKFMDNALNAYFVSYSDNLPLLKEKLALLPCLAFIYQNKCLYKCDYSEHVNKEIENYDPLSKVSYVIEKQVINKNLCLSMGYRFDLTLNM